MYKRGDIHLAKLYPNKGHEVGKTRPVLILQTDMLNDINHTTTIILPLTTVLVENSQPLRYRINSRDNLQKTSEILCDQVRSIDINRLNAQIIASLTIEELMQVEEQMKVILDID